ncbi:hypothetical protein O181_056632 [Austropuccinia psidii MF-1]|uniref:Uncharacterized protein n=1 Tax=Austropuccinia psidii MF-1 TaxID=1389203 RepID=A0A9Q3EG44_9BASI|nr:hypothetical protein [Austropuccinia psidii MF-1]
MKNPEIPIISQPELEISMSNSKQDKSYSECSNKHQYEPVQSLLKFLQGNHWKMLPQIHQEVMNSWNIHKKFLQEEEIVKYSNGCNRLSSKPQIQNIKYWNNKKREVSKEEAPVASTRKPKANQPSQEEKKKKNNWRKQYAPSYRIPKIQKDAMGNYLNMARTLMALKEKEEQK